MTLGAASSASTAPSLGFDFQARLRSIGLGFLDSL